MILEQIAADTRLRLIEEKKLVSPEEMKEKALALAADETFPFEKMLKEPGIHNSDSGMCRFDHSVFYDRCSIRATSLCHRSDHADPEWNERNRHMDLGQGRIPVPYNRSAK